MDHKHSLILSLLIVFIQSSLQLAISDPPQDVTITRSQSATLNCGLDGNIGTDSVIWREHITTTIGRNIYNTLGGGSIDPSKYEVTPTNNRFDLVIKDVALLEGGKYSCSLAIAGDLLGANLVVIDKPRPTIPDLIEGETKMVRCQVEYGSPQHTSDTEFPQAHRPQLEIKVADSPLEGLSPILVPGVPGTSFSTLSLEVNYTATSADTGMNLTCEVKTLTPYYANRGSQLLDIQYIVRDIEIAPNNDPFFVGESINCSAKGNPQPDFRWVAQTSGGSRPVSGPVLQVLETMLGENVWICEASNTVKELITIKEEFKFTVVAAIVTDSPNTGESTGNGGVIAAAVVVPLVAIGVIVVLVLFLLKRRKAKAAGGEEHPGNNEKQPQNSLPPLTEIPEEEPSNPRGPSNNPSFNSEENIPDHRNPPMGPYRGPSNGVPGRMNPTYSNSTEDLPPPPSGGMYPYNQPPSLSSSQNELAGAGLSMPPAVRRLSGEKDPNMGVSMNPNPNPGPPMLRSRSQGSLQGEYPPGGPYAPPTPQGQPLYRPPSRGSQDLRGSQGSLSNQNRPTKPNYGSAV